MLAVMMLPSFKIVGKIEISEFLMGSNDGKHSILTIYKKTIKDYIFKDSPSNLIDSNKTMVKYLQLYLNICK